MPLHKEIEYAKLMPADDIDIQYEFDEIAGLHEFEHGLKRAEAEFLAYLTMKLKYEDRIKSPFSN